MLSAIASQLVMGACSPQPCTIYVGVLGQGSTNSSYAITATLLGQPTQFTRLLAGIPTFGYVSTGNYSYYQVQVGNLPLGASQLIVLTPFTGDPDLYVNFNKSNFPNITKSDA